MTLSWHFLYGPCYLVCTDGEPSLDRNKQVIMINVAVNKVDYECNQKTLRIRKSSFHRFHVDVRIIASDSDVVVIYFAKSILSIWLGNIHKRRSHNLFSNFLHFSHKIHNCIFAFTKMSWHFLILKIFNAKIYNYLKYINISINLFWIIC